MLRVGMFDIEASNISTGAPNYDEVVKLYGNHRNFADRYEQQLQRLILDIGSTNIGVAMMSELSYRLLIQPYFFQLRPNAEADSSTFGRYILITPSLYPPHRNVAAVFLHELVHILRRRARLPPGKAIGRDYSSHDEFYAVLVQNYYLQNRGLTMRRAHRISDPQKDPLRLGTNAWLNAIQSGTRTHQFYVEQFIKDHTPLAKKLANLCTGPFNPIDKVLRG